MKLFSALSLASAVIAARLSQPGSVGSSITKIHNTGSTPGSAPSAPTPAKPASSVTPASGSKCGGTQVELKGLEQFVDADEVQDITFGVARCVSREKFSCKEVPELESAVTSAIEVQATNPDQDQTVPVSVIVKDKKTKQVSTLQVGSYTYAKALTPTFAGFSPASGNAGDVLTVEGTKLKDSSVEFRESSFGALHGVLKCKNTDGVSLNKYSADDGEDLIECVLPAAPAMVGKVLVKGATGFACYEPPEIQSATKTNFIKKHLQKKRPTPEPTATAVIDPKNKSARDNVITKAGLEAMALMQAPSQKTLPLFSFTLSLESIVEGPMSVPGVKTAGSYAGGTQITVVGRGFADTDRISVCGAPCQKLTSPSIAASRYNLIKGQFSQYVLVADRDLHAGQDLDSVVCVVPSFKLQNNGREYITDTEVERKKAADAVEAKKSKVFPKKTISIQEKEPFTEFPKIEDLFDTHVSVDEEVPCDVIVETAPVMKHTLIRSTYRPPHKEGFPSAIENEGKIIGSAVSQKTPVATINVIAEDATKQAKDLDLQMMKDATKDQKQTIYGGFTYSRNRTPVLLSAGWHAEGVKNLNKHPGMVAGEDGIKYKHEKEQNSKGKNKDKANAKISQKAITTSPNLTNPQTVAVTFALALPRSCAKATPEVKLLQSPELDSPELATCGQAKTVKDKPDPTQPFSIKDAGATSTAIYFEAVCWRSAKALRQMVPHDINDFNKWNSGKHLVVRVPGCGNAVEMGRDVGVLYPYNAPDAKTVSRIHKGFEPIEAYAGNSCFVETQLSDCPPKWKCCPLEEKLDEVFKDANSIEASNLKYLERQMGRNLQGKVKRAKSSIFHKSTTEGHGVKVDRTAGTCQVKCLV